MEITQFLFEIYIGNALANRQQLFMPTIMAIQQAIQMCIEASESQEPMKIIFVNIDNEKIEYKNNAYIKMEGG